MCSYQTATLPATFTHAVRERRKPILFKISVQFSSPLKHLNRKNLGLVEDCGYFKTHPGSRLGTRRGDTGELKKLSVSAKVVGGAPKDLTITLPMLSSKILALRLFTYSGRRERNVL